MAPGGIRKLEEPPNKRLQRTGISVPLIDSLPHDAVVARPLKRRVRPITGLEVQMNAPRNQLVNFLPILTLTVAIIAMESSTSDSNTFGRLLMGIHIVAFYVISIRMVFVKNLSKWVILLILFPATAVITYIVLLFLRPRRKDETSPA